MPPVLEGQCRLVKDFNCHALQGVDENRNKKLGFSPNSNLAKANKTNNYSYPTP